MPDLLRQAGPAPGLTSHNGQLSSVDNFSNYSSAKPSSLTLTFSAAIDSYITWNDDLAPRTKHVYGISLRKCARELGALRPIEDIGGAELASWLRAAHGADAPKTFNRELTTLRSFTTWLREQGMAAIELPPVKHRKANTDRTRALDRREVERILGMNAPLRNKTLWRLLYESAARAGEILALNVEDLDIPNRRARVTSKGGDTEWITWSTGTALLLPRLLKGRTSGPLFVTDRKAMRPGAVLDMTADGRIRLSYRRALDVFKAATGGHTLHQLRHSALTHMAEDGASAPMLMTKSRHKSIVTLAIYARPSVDALQRWEAQRDPARRTNR